MQSKRTFASLYLAVLVILAAWPFVHAGADSSDSIGSRSLDINAPSQSLDMGLDTTGKRGLVIFHHNPHESLSRRTNFSPAYLNKSAAATSCIVCHHRRDVTDPSQPDISDVTDPK